MATDGRVASRPAVLESCPSGQASGPMGCGSPMGAEPVSSGAPASPVLSSAVQGQ